MVINNRMMRTHWFQTEPYSRTQSGSSVQEEQCSNGFWLKQQIKTLYGSTQNLSVSQNLVYRFFICILFCILLHLYPYSFVWVPPGFCLCSGQTTVQSTVLPERQTAEPLRMHTFLENGNLSVFYQKGFFKGSNLLRVQCAVETLLSAYSLDRTFFRKLGSLNHPKNPFLLHSETLTQTLRSSVKAQEVLALDQTWSLRRASLQSPRSIGNSVSFFPILFLSLYFFEGVREPRPLIFPHPLQISPAAEPLSNENALAHFTSRRRKAWPSALL